MDVSRRLGGLGELDPLLVPLPHGTEVTTKVERTFLGRRVPQGLVGRVVRERDGGFDVVITGLGEILVRACRARASQGWTAGVRPPA